MLQKQKDRLNESILIRNVVESFENISCPDKSDAWFLDNDDFIWSEDSVFELGLTVGSRFYVWTVDDG